MNPIMWIPRWFQLVWAPDKADGFAHNLYMMWIFQILVVMMAGITVGAAIDLADKDFPRLARVAGWFMDDLSPKGKARAIVLIGGPLWAIGPFLWVPIAMYLGLRTLMWFALPESGWLKKCLGKSQKKPDYELISQLERELEIGDDRWSS